MDNGANWKDEELTKALGPAQDPDKIMQSEKAQRAKSMLDQYYPLIIELIHGEKTHSGVIEMLKSNPDPVISVPQAALSISDMGENVFKQGGMELTIDVLLASSTLIVGDLVMLGVGAGIFEQPDEKETADIYEDTFQMYIERGLKDGSLDPIQLQVETEEVMTKEQKAAGIHAGVQEGIPRTVSRNAEVDQYAKGQVRQAEAKMTKKHGEEKQALLQDMQQPQGG